ncbi:DegT/DnrJ/EryC1/StrS family aminotransferase [Tateyamaria sp.]|uniref:DegT/DnrJ/EryC1/StrS family aminotransferase n=1 Tax=Tateyamaria sp. TaxID=1929288 RepID=UPI00329CC688
MTKIGKRERFGSEERSLLGEALEAQDLWPYVYGNDRRHFIGDAEDALRAYFGAKTDEDPPFVVPTCSGTSSIQVALGGLRIPAGSEVILPPITDIGTVMPIIFQNAIPVFADVDPTSGLLTPETVEAAITERTSAVLVVHLSGTPADVPKIMQVCEPKGIKVIEDVAQGLGASLDGIPLGTLGHAGCFSLNSQKHITAGEGGFVLTNDKDDYFRCHNFSDKHRNRFRSPSPEHAIYNGVGLSLRMSELQGAMILAQLPKLDGIASTRNEFGTTLDDMLKDLPGVVPQSHSMGAYPTFFFHMFSLDFDIDRDTKRAIISSVNNQVGAELDIRFGGSYSYGNVPIYKYPVFENKNFFDLDATGSSQVWPAELVARMIDPKLTANHYDYRKVSCPNAETYLQRSFSTWNDERHGNKEAMIVAKAIEKALGDSGLLN